MLNPIPNHLLTLDQVPPYDVTLLDPNLSGADHRAWREICHFAFTFEGYEYFDLIRSGYLRDSEDVVSLGSLSGTIQAEFEQTGELPTTDLSILRACLFWQQRCCRWLEWDSVSPEDAAFIDALLKGIRSALQE